MSEREPAGVCPWCGAAFTHGTPDCKGFGCGSRFGLITDQTEYCLEQQRDQLKARIAELERDFADLDASYTNYRKDVHSIPKQVQAATCSFCGGPAACFGRYESTLMFACHDCCGHGNEDGWCEPLAGEAVNQ